MRFIFLACLPILAALLDVSAQKKEDLPKEIRGYKVHRQTIRVDTSSDEKQPVSKADAAVKIGEPLLVDAEVTGITFELSAEITSAEQSGKVDFLTFRGFRVNGVAVEIEEYKHSFSFRKGETVSLPKPGRIFLSTAGILQSAWKEMRDTKEEWTVTGRVFVFGKFRRYGLHHKRVVPIDIEVKIRNPLHTRVSRHTRR